MSEVFVKEKYFTCNIMVHLSGYVARAVGESMQEAGLGVADIINSYRSLEGTALEKLKTEGQAIGVDFMDVCIDNLSIPMVVQQFSRTRSGRILSQGINEWRQKVPPLVQPFQGRKVCHWHICHQYLISTDQNLRC